MTVLGAAALAAAPGRTPEAPGPAAGVPCLVVAERLFGVTLGPVGLFPQGLAPGIRREGTAEVIAGVGFESLEGTTHGFDFDRIMLYFDRGIFIGLTAIGHKPNAPHLGREILIRLLAGILGREPAIDATTTRFACNGPLELTVEPTTWGGRWKRLQLTLMDRAAQSRMRTYIDRYCADPKRRRPQDTCPPGEESERQ